jgi:hypothetical protein
VGDQKPVAAALPERMQAVACGNLRELIDNQMGVPAQKSRSFIGLRDLSFKRVPIDAKRRPWNPDGILPHRASDSVDGEKSDDAFLSDSSDLDNSTILHGLDARNQATIDEVQVIDRRAGAKKDLMLSQIHRFEMRPNRFEARVHERPQQPVARMGFPKFVDHCLPGLSAGFG